MKSINLLVLSISLICIFLTQKSLANEYWGEHPILLRYELLVELKNTTGYEFSCSKLDQEDPWYCVNELKRLSIMANQISKEKNFSRVYITTENSGLNFGGRAFVAVTEDYTNEEILNYINSLQRVPEQYEYTNEYRKESTLIQNRLLRRTKYMVVCNEHRLEMDKFTRKLSTVGLAPEECLKAYRTIESFFKENVDLIAKNISGIFLNTTEEIPEEMQMVANPKSYTPTIPLKNDAELDMFGHIWINAKDLMARKGADKNKAFMRLKEQLSKRENWSGHTMAVKQEIARLTSGNAHVFCALNDKRACEEGYLNLLKYVSKEEISKIHSFIIVDKNQKFKNGFYYEGISTVFFPYNFRP